MGKDKPGRSRLLAAAVLWTAAAALHGALCIAHLIWDGGGTLALLTLLAAAASLTACAFNWRRYLNLGNKQETE